MASVDGSHIDVDRHLPARCYLINLGGCLLTYGSASDALLFSNPRLYSRQDELYLSSGDPESRETAAVEGPLLGLVRTVEEVKGLADLLDGSPADLPTLGLLDGSLVLWGSVRPGVSTLRPGPHPGRTAWSRPWTRSGRWQDVGRWRWPPTSACPRAPK